MKGANHEPTLGTILMVERAIHNAKGYPTKTELWKSLPRKVQYQTFTRIINYLIESRKIIIDDRDRRIVWVFPDNPKLRRMLRKAIPVRRRTTAS